MSILWIRNVMSLNYGESELSAFCTFCNYKMRKMCKVHVQRIAEICLLVFLHLLSYKKPQKVQNPYSEKSELSAFSAQSKISESENVDNVDSSYFQNWKRDDVRRWWRPFWDLKNIVTTVTHRHGEYVCCKCCTIQGRKWCQPSEKKKSITWDVTLLMNIGK